MYLPCIKALSQISVKLSIDVVIAIYSQPTLLTIWTVIIDYFIKFMKGLQQGDDVMQ